VRFFCKTIWTPIGKRQAYLMLFIHLGSRKVWLSSATYSPDEAWVKQQGPNAMMWMADHRIETTHLIRDRDAKFSRAFDRLIKSSGIGIVRTPVQAPNANAYAEAWVASLKRECLNHFMCFSLGHLDHIAYRYSRFYNEHRPHQRMGNRVLRYLGEPPADCEQQRSTAPIGRIGCKAELGGLLRHYYRRAA
jgi:putative transposase